MTLSDLASIGGFVSGMAVVITLILLLIQMKQANVNQRALMQQMRSARTIDTLLKVSDRYISETVCAAWKSGTDLSESQILSYLQAMAATLFNWEDSFLQMKGGTLDATVFESDKDALRICASIPAFRVAWRMNRQNYCSGFRELGDSILDKVKVAPTPDLKSIWASMMAEELAAIGK
jgi:hypothetical protein